MLRHKVDKPFRSKIGLDGIGVPAQPRTPRTSPHTFLTRAAGLGGGSTVRARARGRRWRGRGRDARGTGRNDTVGRPPDFTLRSGPGKARHFRLWGSKGSAPQDPSENVGAKTPHHFRWVWGREAFRPPKSTISGPARARSGEPLGGRGRGAGGVRTPWSAGGRGCPRRLGLIYAH